MRAGRAHDLAVGAQLDPQHPVGGGVLGPHVEDHLVGVQIVYPPAVAALEVGGHHSSTCRLGGVTSKGPTPIFSPAMARSAICGVGFTCMPL